jgi:hypothetical protein
VAELSPKAVYDKIDFIHRQCLAFAADRERDLHRLPLRRLHISTDRQDYLVNWTDRKNRGNVKLTAVGSAENRTGYVLAMNLNYDPDVDLEKAMEVAKANGDFDGRPDAFRESARIWLPSDERRPPRTIFEMHRAPQSQPEGGHDIEEVEDLAPASRLPRTGAQIHFEYTVYAHYRLLRDLIGHAGKIRFYTDEDGALLAGFKTAFADLIQAEKVDGATIKIDKTLTVDERRKLVKETKTLVAEYKTNLGRDDISDHEAMVDYLAKEIEAYYNLTEEERARIDPITAQGWFRYPFDTMSEPHKWIKNVNSWPAESYEHAARMMMRSTLHPIDRFFMQIRRLVMMLERPISTPSNDGRTWRGYSAYNPRIIQKLLDIYRVYYNYVAVGEDKKTPAMRLGLAMGPVKLETILYFDPLANHLPAERPKPRRRAAPTGSLARPRRWVARDPQATPVESEKVSANAAE